MLILAIDTSGRHGSVALCRADANSLETLSLSDLEGGTYSAGLIPAISEILQQHNFTLGDLAGFAIVTGPGSFTGLRVGLATVKGLCEIVHKPLVDVSLLEAIAITYGTDGETVISVLDAGRGEVYVGEYEVVTAAATPVREYIIKLAAFAEEALEARDLLTPDAYVANFLHKRGVTVRTVAPVKADGIARIGLRKLLAGDVADHATVDVNYIRRSDAEIFSAPKR